MRVLRKHYGNMRSKLNPHSTGKFIHSCSFLRQRFNPPLNVGIHGDSIDDDDFDRATIGANIDADQVSVFSMSSVTTEGRVAMLEYQS